MASKLTPLGKITIVVLVAAAAFAGWRTFGHKIDSIIGGKSNNSEFSNTVINDDSAKLNRPVRVAINTWPGFVGGIVANNGLKPTTESIFWKKGIQVEFKIMEDPVAMRNEFAAGRVDVIWETIDTAAISFPGLIASGVNPKAFMQVDWSAGGDGIVGNNSVKNSVESLRGKKVALLKQSPSEFFLMYVLKNSSLTKAEQQSVLDNAQGMDSPDQLRDAFLAGNVDAIVTWEPNISNIIAAGGDRGAHRVIDTSLADRAIGDVFVASSDFINQNPQVIRAFVEGWFEGVSEANRNKLKASQLMMEHMPYFAELGEQKTMNVFSQVRLTGMADNARTFLGGSPQFALVFNEASALYSSQGVLDNRVPAAKATSVTAIKEMFDALDPEDRVVAPPVANVPTESERQTAAAKVKQPNYAPSMTKRVTITFATNSSALSAESKAHIAVEIGNLLRVNSNAIVSIEGNTDSVGNRQSNIVLSLARANAVMRYLVNELGFPKEMFLVTGHGPDNPVADNATVAGRSSNRRTDIKIINKG